MSSHYKTALIELEQKIRGPSPMVPNLKKRKHPSKFIEENTSYDDCSEEDLSGDEGAGWRPSNSEQQEAITISSDDEEERVHVEVEEDLMPAAKRSKTENELERPLRENEYEHNSFDFGAIKAYAVTRSKRFATKKTASVPVRVERQAAPVEPTVVADPMELSFDYGTPSSEQCAVDEAEAEFESELNAIVLEEEKAEAEPQASSKVEQQVATAHNDNMEIDLIVPHHQSAVVAPVVLAFAPTWQSAQLPSWAKKIEEALLPSRVKKIAIVAAAGTAVAGLAAYAMSYHPEMVYNGVANVQTALKHIAAPLVQPLATYAAPRMVAASGSVQPLLLSLQERIQPAFERVIDRIIPSITELGNIVRN